MGTGPKDKMAQQRSGTSARGGARPFAGRPSTFGVSKAELRELFRTLKKKSKEAGVTWQGLFAERLYGEDERQSTAYMRMLTDMVKISKQERDVTITETKGPTIFLPDENPAPAVVVPIKKAG